MRRWTFWSTGILVVSLMAGGCGGGGSSSTPGTPTVTISPIAAAVALNGARQFTAGVTGVKTIAITADGAVRTSGVVTITTAAAHGLAVGDVVTIQGVTDTSFLGTFLVASVPSTTTFTYSQTGADATSGGGTVSNISVKWFVNDVEGGNTTTGTISTVGVYTAPSILPPAVTATIASNGAVRASNTVTITTTAKHGFLVGQIVTLSGVADATFNGTFQIATVPSDTTFTYSQAGSNVTSSGGNISSFAVKVKAVSVADSTASATAVVSLISGIGVSVSPKSAVLGTNETVQFFSTVTGTANSAVTWSVNGIEGGDTNVGMITTNGLYTAPASPPNAQTVNITNSGAVRSSNQVSIAPSGAVRSSNVVTITTTTAHAFTVGQNVTISGVGDGSFNGSFQIVSVPSQTSFTYSQTGPNATSGGGTVALTQSVVTITTTAAHGFSAGQTVTIAGVADTSFNGTFPIVSIPSTTSFKYAQNGPDATSGGGTATSASSSVTIKATSVADTTQSATTTARVVVAQDPSVISISPSRAAQGSLFQDVYLTGTNLISTSVVRLNGAIVPSVELSDKLLRARVPDTILGPAPSSPLTFTVARQIGAPQNCAPDPTKCQFTVVPVRPALTGASPDSAIEGGGPLSFKVNGGYFGTSASTPSVTAEYDGSVRPATVAARQLEVTIGSTTTGANDLVTPGLYSVAVRNSSVTEPAGAPQQVAVTNLAVQPDPQATPPSVISTLAVGTKPQAVAINTVTGVAVVANHDSNNITLIDLTGSVPAVIGSPLAVGVGPTGVAVDNVRNLAVVANNGDNSISVVNLATSAVTTITKNVGTAPVAVGVNPLTGMGVVVYQSTNNAALIDLTSNPPAIVAAVQISTGAAARVSVDPRLNWALVTPGGGGTLSIVDLGRRTTVGVTSTGAVRASQTVTITTADTHGLAVGQPVLITGVTDPSFDGTFTVVSAPSTTTFTYSQSAPDASSGGGSIAYSPALATLTVGVGIRGVAFNSETKKAILTDPSSNSIQLFSGLDQTVVGFPVEQGLVAAAINPLTDTGVVLNTTTNQATIIDPRTPAKLGTITLTGTNPVAVAIDPGSNLAVFANEASNNVTIVSLGAVRPLQVTNVALPIGRQIGPDMTLTSTSDLTLTVIGKGFASTSVVRLDGTALPTPASATDRELTVTIPAALLARAREYAVDVVNPGGAHSNTVGLTVVQPVDLVSASCASPAPGGVAIDEQRDLAVVTDSGCDSVSLVDLNAATVTNTVPVGVSPQGVAVISRLGKAVVANRDSNSASILDIDNPASSPVNVNVGSQPVGVAIDQDNGRAVVTNSGTASNSVSVLELEAPGAPQTVGVAGHPVAVAIDSERGLAAVANAASNSVSLVDISQNAVVGAGTVSGIQLPSGVVFDPITGLFVATASLGNNVALINPDTKQASSLRVGVNPTSLAYNFQTGTLVTVNSASQTITVVDFIDRRVRAVFRMAASQQFAVAIHPRTNLAVIADTANNRVLLVPLPR